MHSLMFCRIWVGLPCLSSSVGNYSTLSTPICQGRPGCSSSPSPHYCPASSGIRLCSLTNGGYGFPCLLSTLLHLASLSARESLITYSPWILDLSKQVTSYRLGALFLAWQQAFKHKHPTILSTSLALQLCFFI